ncbi:MAG: AAA family ATPase [Dehalococcoidales bacterium]|nr:AAA family ATPase [Dehalococcoidales bacterium]
MINDKCFIKNIKLNNFLSYGPESEETELRSLNVLIGPNLSGKSNLVEAFSILRSAPSDLGSPIRLGGGVSEWLWKGSKTIPIAQINVIVDYPPGPQPLRYKLCFTMVGQRLELVNELLENKDKKNQWEDDVYFYYRYDNGLPTLNVRDVTNKDATYSSFTRHLKREDIDLQQSVLSQRKDPDQYPELTFIGNNLSKIKLYREWDLGRYTPPRLPQKADLPQDFLLEDASNLALVLNSMEHKGTKRELLNNLKQFAHNIEDFTTKIEGGTVQLFLHEKGLNEPIPATRLSDGTLRYLCLLAILCHPTPPPLICIEEPELSLHPDVLKNIAELLTTASNRTQLIVTTHSDALVSALSGDPENIVVCERDSKGTTLRRLDQKQLESWLKKYSLGDLWRMGELGGNPW